MQERKPTTEFSRRQTSLLAWFEQAARPLPWRETRNPWLILLSEVLLQQTQVARIRQRWPELATRFATPEDCAATPLAEVIAMWSGLGFNRRALNLHRCATQIVQRHNGCVPSDLKLLLDLAGVGPYTARAVRVFAFEIDDAVLDTNVARVIARLAGRPLKRQEAQAAADAHVPEGQGWAWNQALLDLGATICTARQPSCGRCPLSSTCAWSGDFSVDDPAKGSAGVSVPQSKFHGSDRQGRGRLVAALTEAPVGEGDLSRVMGWPAEPERAVQVAASLVADGLITHSAGHYKLAN